MTGTLTIPLEPTARRETFEAADRNLIQVRVQLADGTMVTDSDCIVDLSLSRDAMVGLATELLRAACREGQLGWELRPIDRDLASQVLGVFVHSRSCRLNVWQVELGTVSHALREEAKRT